MKLQALRLLMALAWTVDDYAKEFVKWAEQRYLNEVHGIGRLEP